MAVTVTAIDVKEYGLQIKNNATFVTVSGMTNLTVSEGRDEIEATVDAAQFKTYLMGDRDWSLQLDGLRLTAASGVRDAGQKLVEKAARTDGYSGIRTYRVVKLATPSADYIEMDCYAMLGDFGGGRNGTTSWGCTLRLAPGSQPSYHGEFDENNT